MLQADPGARPQSVRSVLSSLEGSASERLSPIVSTATATSAEPVRWLSIVALVGLALCWLVTGFRPLEHVNFGRVDPDDFADFSRELIQELGTRLSVDEGDKSMVFRTPRPSETDPRMQVNRYVFGIGRRTSPLCPASFN
jgi:hypothetical protein